MKISLINGSQKPGESNSGIILDRLNDLVKENHDVQVYKPISKHLNYETLEDITSGDIIVLAFPLYWDSVPSHTLKMLVELENTIKREGRKSITVYAIVNNGFYEGKQNHIALEIIKHWCEHCGIQFGGGIGQGAGEMLGATKNITMAKGIFKNLWDALKLMVEKMEAKEPFDVIYLNPFFPRFLFNMVANSGWSASGRKNKLTRRDIMRRL